MARSLRDIANEIEKDWGAKVNYAARPYLDAMHDLDKITDNYMLDKGTQIVAYFLGNATSWRGEVARRVKKELNDMLHGKGEGVEGPSFRALVEELKGALENLGR